MPENVDEEDDTIEQSSSLNFQQIRLKFLTELEQRERQKIGEKLKNNWKPPRKPVNNSNEFIKNRIISSALLPPFPTPPSIPPKPNFKAHSEPATSNNLKFSHSTADNLYSPKLASGNVSKFSRLNSSGDFSNPHPPMELSNPSPATNLTSPTSSRNLLNSSRNFSNSTSSKEPNLILSRNSSNPNPYSNMSGPNLEANKNSSGNVRDAINRLNKIGPRLFENPTTSTNSMPNSPNPDAIPGKSDKAEDTWEEAGDNPLLDIVSGVSDTASSTSGNSDGDDFPQESLKFRKSEDNKEVDEASNRKSSICKSDTLHTTILNEMRTKGLFKKLSFAFSGDMNLSAEEMNGKLRNKAVRSRPDLISESPDLEVLSKSPCEIPTELLEEPTNPNNGVLLRAPSNLVGQRRKKENNTISIASSQSGSNYSDIPERDSDLSMLYNTGDEKENKRLRDLHGITREFCQLQKNYVELLQHIGENYPKFLTEVAKHPSKSNSSESSAIPLVIKRITDHFKQIFGVHKMLLDDFYEKYSKWDSANPDFASVLQQKAEFLKICSSFLKEKRSLCSELQQALDENKELAYATKKFEDEILNGNNPLNSNNNTLIKSPTENGIRNSLSAQSLRGISIVMHLDSVHQNVVRYRLLMERYLKHLPESSPEATIAAEALKKLIAVSNTVNGFLADADADKKLLEMHRKLEGVFDVFAPGRRLIHEGELQRQTRKDLQLRYLILFSDTLLICRYTTLGSSDSIETARLYKIPIERVRLRVENHEDYEREFVVISPKKSSAFVAKSKRERDIWVSRIAETRYDFKEKRRKRRSYVLKNKPSTSYNNSCEDSPEVESRPFPNSENIPDQINGKTNGIGGDSLPQIITQKPSINRVPLRASHRYEALWIPDNKATKCLMAGCDTKFNMLRRKHHCRQCGWLICNNCVGYAPVKIKNFEKVKVCPQCFYEIKQSFENGTLFPYSMIRTFKVDSTIIPATSLHPPHLSITEHDVTPTSTSTNGCLEGDSAVQRPQLSVDDSSIRIAYSEQRYEQPKDLFNSPRNGDLKKAKIPARLECDGEAVFLASGKVLTKNRKGVDVVRWARLTKEIYLQFYEAEFDDEPIESHFVYGYTLSTNELDDGGYAIELTHQNQFQTGRKADRVQFQILHAKSAEKWLESLRIALGYEEADEAINPTDQQT